jgi:hypothetical protein
MVLASAATLHRTLLRAEMSELGLRGRRPYPGLVLGLIAAADTASAILTLLSIS